MLNFIRILILGLLLSSCVKEKVTIIGSASPADQKSDERHVVQGTINGGGGKGVLCEKDGKVEVEVLDLYEAKALYDQEIVAGPNTQGGALRLFAELFAKHMWNPDTIPMEDYVKALEEQLQENWLQNIRFIDSRKKLKLIDDSFELLVEEGCEMVQIAAYYDQSILLIDKSYWDKMNWLNRIALLAHELIYYMERENGATNSISTRKLVGQLFSKEGLRPMAHGVPGSDSQYGTCSLYDGAVDVGYGYLYKSELGDEKGLELVFNYLPQQSSFFRASTFFVGQDLGSFADPNQLVSAQSDLQVDTYQTPTRTFYLHTSEEGKRQVRLFDKRKSETLGPYELRCEPPAVQRNGSEVDPVDPADSEELPLNPNSTRAADPEVPARAGDQDQ